MYSNLEINNQCISCDSCRQICPENAILSDGDDYSIDNWSCSFCDLCRKSCPTNAIKVVLSKD